MTALDVVPVLATVGGGFLAGTLIGYAVKKVLKFVAVIAGLFIAGLAISAIPARHYYRLDEASRNIARWNYNTCECTHTYIK